jgi:transposase
MKPHQDAVIRLAEVPGLGADSAQQIIAEVGAQASTFPSAAELTSWVGTCPGKEESAEQNHSSRSAKGNKYLRRVLNQAAHAAVAKKGSHFQIVFRRLLPPPRLSVRHLGRCPSALSRSLEDFAFKECGLSSKAAKWIREKRRNAPRCWPEPFASSATRSPSHR